MSRSRFRRRHPKPELSVAQILTWADEFRSATARWPGQKDGPVSSTPCEKWGAIDMALRAGYRSLPGGSSLARLLAEFRGVRNPKGLPPYTAPQLLAWADAHFARSGRWPRCSDGPVADAPGETWLAVDMALRLGDRGMPGGSSLARLLAQHHGASNAHDLPSHSVGQVLIWADAHKARTGTWPSLGDGPVFDAPGEAWGAIDSALREGSRALPGGSSLARVLAEHRGVVPGRRRLRPVPEEEVLGWADAFYAREGRWPRSDDGPILGAEGKTWLAVHLSLKVGRRGFSGGSSLAHFLVEHGRGRNRKGLPPLAVPQVLAWAEAHRARTGRRPTQRSGAIPEATGETWMGVHIALSLGRRGFPGGSSLLRLLREHQ